MAPPELRTICHSYVEAPLARKIRASDQSVQESRGSIALSWQERSEKTVLFSPFACYAVGAGLTGERFICGSVTLVAIAKMTSLLLAVIREFERDEGQHFF